MAFDFPSSPTLGQQYAPAGGPTYQWDGTAWKVISNAPTAETRNRIVNGAMQISQEQGNTAGTSAGYYAADQWTFTFLSTGTFTAQRVQSVTPNGSKDRLRYTISVADAALAAGDYLFIRQSIEGSRVADFRYGTASSKQSILRFGFKAPAGTYSIALKNSASNRSYIANFTISAGQANTDTEQLFVIPGDTTGTWLTDTGVGIYVNITLATGTTFHGVAGWQAGNVFGTASNTNGMAAAGAVFELFDCGLYLDDQVTGLPPKWQMPDEAEELQACQRYWQTSLAAFDDQATITGQVEQCVIKFSPNMRIAPAISYGTAHIAPSNCGAVIVTSGTNTTSSLSIGTTSLGAGRFYYYAPAIMNARM